MGWINNLPIGLIRAAAISLTSVNVTEKYSYYRHHTIVAIINATNNIHHHNRLYHHHHQVAGNDRIYLEYSVPQEIQTPP